MSTTHRTIVACLAATCVQGLVVSNSFAAPPSASLAPEYAPSDSSDASDPTLSGPERPATLLGSSRHSVGGFGALESAYTRIAGRDAALACFEGAFLFDHRISLGASGCSTTSRIDATQYGNVVHSPGDRLEVAYGGLAVRYHFLTRDLFQLSLGATIGGGAVAISNPNESWSYDDHGHHKSSDPFFSFEPRLTGYLNLTRWARLGAFAGYRFASGIDTANLSAGDIAGPTVGGTLQFGWF